MSHQHFSILVEYSKHLDSYYKDNYEYWQLEWVSKIVTHCLKLPWISVLVYLWLYWSRISCSSKLLYHCWRGLHRAESLSQEYVNLANLSATSLQEWWSPHVRAAPWQEIRGICCVSKWWYQPCSMCRYVPTSSAWLNWWDVSLLLQGTRSSGRPVGCR